MRTEQWDYVGYFFTGVELLIIVPIMIVAAIFMAPFALLGWIATKSGYSGSGPGTLPYSDGNF